ncbi:hypothetical protein DIS24_g3934 [Lasiodiplodia hormozganensis]|uniref:Uncharacterized protein n=1 Tax=Lasiodiplodia hormozganensis TaxID=869390 RepID=A0AA39YW52_9PEZI|nr:hypothetical protein DIS24_g3934 [Lasiodiplodia hormozganensis]
MPFAGYEIEENATKETGSFEANASTKSEDSVSSSVLSLEGDRKETIVNLQSKEAQLRAINDEEDGVDRCPLCAWELKNGECAQCVLQFDENGIETGENSFGGFSDIMRAINDEEDDVDRCPLCAWKLENGKCAKCGLQFDDNSTITWENSFGSFSDIDETSEHKMSGEKEKKDKGLPKPLQEAPIPQVNIWKQRAESNAVKSKVSNAAIKPTESAAKSPARTSPNKAGDAKVNFAR